MPRGTRFPSTLDRYLASAYARAAVATLVAVVAIVVVIDFADRAYSFEGPGWIRNVIRLYANLSLDLAYQVAPSALLLAAGIAVSGLRSHGEITALLSLGVDPRRVMAAVGLTCALGSAGVALMNEWVVVDAARRAEEIKLTKFKRQGDLPAYFSEQRWFRGDGRIYHLRGSEGDAFLDVSVYELGPGFRLVRRIDAARMEPVAGGWLFQGVVVSSFREGERTRLSRLLQLVLPLPETPEDFRLRVGRPRQFGIGALFEQIAVRERVGLDSAEYRLELHGRFAYPFTAVPGALLAILLAMRRDRKGNLTVALAEGILISLVMWSMLIACRALGTSGQLPPAVAAWTPFVLLSLIAAGYQAYQEAETRRRIPVEAAA